ncbi:glutathione degradosome, partial [Hygrophoropsis aurantiaca]
ASVSRRLPSTAPKPSLLHSLGDENKSVLSLMADVHHIYTGGQCQDISVWDKHTFTLKATLRGHTGSILALEYAEEKKWLFSASGDSTVRIWSTVTLDPIYVLYPYLETGAGDLFSLAWNSSLKTIYIGCQNTSLQWFSFCKHHMDRCPQEHVNSGTSTPTRRAHKFFDSYPQYQHRPADLFANNLSSSPPSDTDIIARSGSILNIPASNVIDSAHFGYIYCMVLVPPNREGSDSPPAEDGTVHLITGSGDETIKLWNCTPLGPKDLHTFECCHGAVLSLAVRGESVYAGCQDGYVKVFDLETKTLVRTIIVQETIDVLSLSIMNSDLYTCSANGQIQRWSSSFDCTASWHAHNGIVLSSTITRSADRKGFFLVSGANDGFINVWDIFPPSGQDEFTSLKASNADSAGSSITHDSDTMIFALSTFISIPSISSDPSHREDCRQAAIWLKKCLHQLGAESAMLPTQDEGNPLVLATFHGTQGQHPKPRILFYGVSHTESSHYDVISAPRDGWNSDPFELKGRNGYLYGRGVTDNKGPIMAVACAAADLLRKRALGVDLVFLIEGEEETGSSSFMESVKKHKHLIGDVDAILLSNSTWITDYPPCITYGLRGVVHSTIEACQFHKEITMQISSGAPDLHSGVEGGAASEPMLDMIRLLATLTDSKQKVAISHFYDSVRSLTKEEERMYSLLAQVTQRSGTILSSRWREPSLTVHNIEVSGPGNSTVIPGKVTAKVSLRIVPDQELDFVAGSLVDHLNQSFTALQSPNQLKVTINHKADWWLGNLDDPWFKALENAVHDEWGAQPLRIREGGSIPSIPCLEKEFGCHALHLPLGQSTDQAHLPNERISLSNLQRGKSVIERFLTTAAN